MNIRGLASSPTMRVIGLFFVMLTPVQASLPTDSYAQEFSHAIEAHIGGPPSRWQEKAALFSNNRQQPSLLSGAVPLMLETWFNLSSQQFLVNSGLLKNRQSQNASRLAPGGQYLPAGAKVLLLSWWPVSATGATPIPLWQAQQESNALRSNGYLHWPAVVLVQAAEQPNAQASSHATDISQVALAGKFQTVSQRKNLDDLFHIPVTTALAAHWNAQSAGNKLSRMVLGRPLQSGDFLALVAAHGLWGNGANGQWLTLWWQPDRPAGLRRLGSSHVTQHYAFDSCNDSTLPREADGSPNSCFNPWLEGGLISHKGVSSSQSNCISCHMRASIPPRDFLTPTQGRQTIPEYARGTAMLWAPALSADLHQTAPSKRGLPRQSP